MNRRSAPAELPAEKALVENFAANAVETFRTVAFDTFDVRFILANRFDAGRRGFRSMMRGRESR
jgi:hypothetical protein